MRSLWGERTELRTLDANIPGVAVVAIPGFGNLAVGEHPKLGLRALLFTNFNDDKLAPLEREAVRKDDHIEVELLPNVSQEERMVVVVEDA
jgi:hypothetical protein